MEILNKILPLILTAIMSVNLSGCGNSTDADGSQPAETSAAIAHIDESETNYITTDDITIDGVEGKFPFRQSDLAKEFEIRHISTNGYDLHYENNIWYGDFCCNDSSDDTVYFMRINPTSKGIKIFGYKIDDKSTLHELEEIYGSHQINNGKPDGEGDIIFIKTTRENINVTIVFDDQNKVDHISISLIDMEE